MSSLNLELAGSRYRFAGLNPEQDGLVSKRFSAFLCPDDRKPDVRIDVHHDPDAGAFMRRPPGPNEYRIAIAHHEHLVEVDGIGFRAKLDRSPLAARMQTCLSNAWFLGAFENVFRVLAAYRLFGEGGLMMHSAAFTDGDRGFLLCGRSGAGKTTLCGLAKELDLDILSDELNAVSLSDGALELWGMPFAGDFGAEPRVHLPFPLSGLLALAQSAAPSVRGCSKAEAISRIVASCPYINTDPSLTDALTSRAAELTSRTSPRILSFAKDTRFWSLLDHEYRSRDALSH